MPARPAVYLIAHADYDREQHQPQAEAQQGVVHLYEQPDKNAEYYYDQQEAGAAPGVEAALRPHVLHRQRQALLVAEDGLVLGPVVGEEPLHVLHPRAEPEIDQEDDQLYGALDEAAEGIPPLEAGYQPGEEGGQEQKQRQREHNAEHRRYGDDRLLRLLAAQLLLQPEVELGRLLLFLLGQEAGGVGERAHALYHRIGKDNDAADEGPAEHGVLVLDELELLHLLGHALAGAADYGLPVRPAHQYALYQRLAAYRRPEAGLNIFF